jgi:ABC-type xylose transport system permease subunit
MLLVATVLTTILIWAVWNMVVVPIFGLPPITLMQALLIGGLIGFLGGYFRSRVTIEQS